MKNIVLSLVVIMLGFIAHADSPLTSTNFYTVYEEYDIVKNALNTNGELTTELMEYLSDRTYPIDVKIAVINALGWDLDGRHNFDNYINFIEINSSLQREQDNFYEKLDADELLCLAYLKAMDNYFEVADAKKLSELAVAKTRRSQRSYSFNLIDALIGAQLHMRGNWCELYQTTLAVKENFKLRKDFPDEAERIVFDYMDLYKTECK